MLKILYMYVNFTSFIGIELYRKNKDDNEYSEKDFYVKLIYDNAQLGNDIPYSEFYEKIKEKIVKVLMKWKNFVNLIKL